MTRRAAVRIALLALLVAAIAVIYFTPLHGYFTKQNVRLAVEQLRGVWYGPAAFIGIFAVACMLALPASVFVVAAGFIWGGVAGAIYSILGGMLGAVGAYYLGRFIGDGLLARFGRVGKMVAKQVDHAGFRSLLVLRFIPGIPFAALNFGAGVAGVRMRDYLGATFLGIIPPMFVFAWCADALFNGSMTEGDAFRRLAIVCALMLTLTMIPVVVKKLARPVAVSENGPDGPADPA